jgi:hypothetical protein
MKEIYKIFDISLNEPRIMRSHFASPKQKRNDSAYTLSSEVSQKFL